MAQRPDRGAPRPSRHVGKVTSKKIFDMLAVMVRNQEVFEDVSERKLLTETHLAEVHPGYGLLWRIATDFHARRGAMPRRNHIVSAFHQILDDKDGLLLKDELTHVDKLLDHIFDDRYLGKDFFTDRACIDEALDTCRTIRKQQLVIRARDELTSESGDRIAIDIPQILESLDRAYNEITKTSENLVQDVFPEGWDVEPGITLVPTGVKTIDNMTGGGISGGEVLAFMAPMGACKTVVAVQIASNWAVMASILHTENPGKGKPVCFMVSTEMDTREFRMRILSYLAKIPWKRVRDTLGPGRGISALSDARRPAACNETQYEKNLFEKDGAFECEQRRVSKAINIVRSYLVFLNCTDANPKRPYSNLDGIAEVRAWIKATVVKNKLWYPAGIVIDHASAMAYRMIGSGANGLTKDDLRHILRGIPQQAGESIAKRYHIPCVVMHQLSGEANSRSGVAKIHHTDAAECKSFAEFADFAIVSGQPSPDEYRVCLWRMTKHRREPPRDEAQVRIIGNFSHVLDSTGKFATVIGKSQLVPISEAAMRESVISRVRPIDRDTEMEGVIG